MHACAGDVNPQYLRVTRVTAAGLVDLGGADIELAETIIKEFRDAARSAQRSKLDLADPDIRAALVTVVCDDLRAQFPTRDIGSFGVPPLPVPAADAVYRRTVVSFSPAQENSYYRYSKKWGGEVVIALGRLFEFWLTSAQQRAAAPARVASIIAHEFRHAADRAYRIAAGAADAPPDAAVSAVEFDSPDATWDAYINDPDELKSWAGQVAAERRIAFGADAAKRRTPQAWKVGLQKIWKHIRPENRHDFLSRVYREFVTLGPKTAQTDEPDLSHLLRGPSETAQIGAERAGKPRGNIARYVSPHGSHRYVYVVDGHAVAGLQIVRVDAKTGQAAQAFTDPAYRRQGLATALLERARQDFAEIRPSKDLSEAGAAWQESWGRQAAIAFPPKETALKTLIDDANIPYPPDFVAADVAWKRWRNQYASHRSSPRPVYTGGELDAVNQILGLAGDARVSGLLDGFERLTRNVRDWRDPKLEFAIEVLREVPGLERLRLPEFVMQRNLDDAEAEHWQQLEDDEERVAAKIPYSMMDERSERARYEQEARERAEQERKNKERRLQRTRVPVVQGVPVLQGEPAAPGVTRVAAPEEWQLTPENEPYPNTQQVLPELKREAPKTPEQLGIEPNAGVENILRVYREATPEEAEYWGRWYRHAGDDVLAMAEHYGLPFEQVAAVVAALSPGNKWAANLRAADDVLSGNDRTNAYPNNLVKARHILETGDVDVIRTPKVWVFYQSLLDPDLAAQDMVLDGHAINIWRGQKVPLKGLVGPNETERRAMLDDYKRAAAILGVPVQAVQAVTWYIWKYTGHSKTAGPERVQALKAKYPAREAEIDQMAAADPTAPRYSYLEWMLRQPVAPTALRTLLTRFERYKRYLPNRDINRYTAASLTETLDAYNRSREQEQSKELEDATARAEVVYSEGGWQVARIYDYPTMCALGEGRWCVGYTHTRKYWDAYMTGRNGQLYKIDGPTEDAPYLLYVRDGAATEIKDRRNKDVAADDEVHAIISEALGVDSGEVAEEPWAYEDLEGILRRGFAAWVGWGGQFVIDGDWAYTISGDDAEETISHILDWARADWTPDGQTAAQWARQSDRQKFAETVTAWWHSSGGAVQLPRGVDGDPKAQAYALAALDMLGKSAFREQLGRAFKDTDWSQLPDTPPGGSVWIFIDEIADTLFENDTAIDDASVLGVAVRLAEQGVKQETLEPVLAAGATTEGEIMSALGLASRVAVRTAALTLSRRGYQRYEGCLPDGRKVQVGAAERVAHGSYPSGQRQRRERAWFVRVGGEEVGTAPNFQAARALLASYVAGLDRARA